MPTATRCRNCGDAVGERIQPRLRDHLGRKRPLAVIQNDGQGNVVITDAAHDLLTVQHIATAELLNCWGTSAMVQHVRWWQSPA
jgi:hypothetical protein